MIITRKRLPRRTFLRGLGTMLSIPMLDAMVPALAHGRAFELKAPTRMAFVPAATCAITIDVAALATPGML